MADKTFRQTVEEIVSSQPICHTRKCIAQKISCTKCRNNVTNAILEAVLKMAEGMPKLKGTWDGSQDVYDFAKDRQYSMCQNFIKENIK